MLIAQLAMLLLCKLMPKSMSNKSTRLKHAKTGMIFYWIMEAQESEPWQ
jgi:hypothetical protein